MSVTLDRKAYKDLGLNLPDLVKKRSAGHARARQGTLDTGAQLTIANESELSALVIKRNSLFPLAMTVNTVTRSGIDLIGGVFLVFSAYDKLSQKTRSTRHLFYISRSINGIYLSEEACLSLGFVSRDMGALVQSVNAGSVNKCINNGVGPDDSCACPTRQLPPPQMFLSYPMNLFVKINPY